MTINNLDLMDVYMEPCGQQFKNSDFFQALLEYLCYLTMPESMSFNKYQKTDVLHITFLDHSTINLEFKLPKNHVYLEI